VPTDPPSAETIVIRKAVEADWRAFRELRLAALATEPLAFGSTWEKEHSFPDERWRERLAPGSMTGDSATWVAVDPDGRLVGMLAAGTPDSEPHLFSMWVDPAQRNRGVGGRLLDAAIAWAEATPAGRVLRLDVNPRQEVAVRLYESRGFRRLGGSSPLGHTPGEVLVRMVRPLAGSGADLARPRRGPDLTT
jgi:ribosomal protein S18 acetylase RimI-like enzyme